MKQIYTITINSDQIEGRGHPIVEALFVHEADAITFKQKQKYVDIAIKPTFVFESYDEYVEKNKESAKLSRLLEKLSKEELELIKNHLNKK